MFRPRSEFGLICWGSEFNKVNDVPALSNPVAVSMGFGLACAIDGLRSGTVVVCWGSSAAGTGATTFVKAQSDLHCYHSDQLYLINV